MRTVACCLLLAACSEPGVSEPPLASVDLRAAIASGADVTPIGLALGADGARFVFDESLGLARVNADGTAAMVMAMTDLPNPGPTAPVMFPITDILAMGPNQFAITAIGDGYRLDTAALTLTQYFCYLPDGTPVSYRQRTDAIAFDPASQRLFAQPVTRDLNGTFIKSEIAAYDKDSGVDLEWHQVGDDVAATGMAFIPGTGLVLGQGSRLTRYDLATETTTDLADLARFGVRSIDGLAVDSAAGTLVVVDKDTDELVDIELTRIGL